MPMTALHRNRSIRREAMREQLSVQCHYQHLIDALEGMSELATGDIDQASKDRFSMLSVIADKHWRIVDRYLPALPTATTQESPAGNTKSALQRAIGQIALRIASERTQPTNEPMSTQAHSERALTAHHDDEVHVSIVG